jgi:hypothetical protein
MLVFSLGGSQQEINASSLPPQSFELIAKPPSGRADSF